MTLRLIVAQIIITLKEEILSSGDPFLLSFLYKIPKYVVTMVTYIKNYFINCHKRVYIFLYVFFFSFFPRFFCVLYHDTSYNLRMQVKFTLFEDPIHKFNHQFFRNHRYEPFFLYSFSLPFVSIKTYTYVQIFSVEILYFLA